MKLSKLKSEIKEYIVEILSEVDDTATEKAANTAAINAEKLKIKASQEKLANLQKGVTESEDEDREPTKAELEKEKVKTVSKFKVSNDDFQDFKTKLSTLVKKIKTMEKGAEKDKKMAALKQFIKKPELVKAFKERDVKIDTGDLVG
jgi:hypothetical protein